MEELTGRDRVILAFEDRHFEHAGKKDEQIRLAFGISTAKYYQLLNLVIDKPAALAEQPLLVKRLLRRRDARVRARASRRFVG